MVSRVEALTQALRAGEVDIRRLENEVSSMTQKNQDSEASHQASIEQLKLCARFTRLITRSSLMLTMCSCATRALTPSNSRLG